VVQTESRDDDFIRVYAPAKRRELGAGPSFANKEAGPCMEPAKLQGDYHDGSQRCRHGLCRKASKRQS